MLSPILGSEEQDAMIALNFLPNSTAALPPLPQTSQESGWIDTSLDPYSTDTTHKISDSSNATSEMLWCDPLNSISTDLCPQAMSAKNLPAHRVADTISNPSPEIIAKEQRLEAHLKAAYFPPIPAHMVALELGQDLISPIDTNMELSKAPPWLSKNVSYLLDKRVFLSPQVASAGNSLLLKETHVECLGVRILGTTHPTDGVLEVKLPRAISTALRPAASPPLQSPALPTSSTPLASTSMELSSRTPQPADMDSMAGQFVLKLRRSHVQHDILYHEALVLDHLQARGCLHSPRFLLYGTLRLSPGNDWRWLLTDCVGVSFYDALVSKYSQKLDLLGDVIPTWWHLMKSAVEEVHRCGVIHGDLKPAHFVVVDAQHDLTGVIPGHCIKIIDFGGAAVVRDGITSANQIMMSRAFASADQIAYQQMSCGGDLCSAFYSLVTMIYKLYTTFALLPYDHQLRDASETIALTPPSCHSALHAICRSLVKCGLNYDGNVTLHQKYERCLSNRGIW